LSEILFDNEEMKNIEFEYGFEYQRKHYEISENFRLFNFAIDENHRMIRFNNITDFCLDKLNGEWIVLVPSDETSESIRSLVEVFEFVVLILIVIMIPIALYTRHGQNWRLVRKKSLKDFQ
jgi:hypothetical protein